MMNSDFLNQTYFSLTIIDWLILAGIWWGTFLVFALAKRILASRFGRFSKRTKNKVDDYIFIVIKNTKLFFLVAVGLYTAIQFVDSSDIVDLVVEKLTIALFLVQLMIWVNKLIAYYVERYKEEKMEEDAGAVTTIQALGFVGRLVLYSIIILVALDNFGVEVTTLVASLGIGGIAVALAVQNILGDLLSQFVSSKLCTFSARLSVATQLFCFVDWLHVK